MSHLVPWTMSLLEYALLMRVPLLIGGFLFLLPLLVQLRSVRALLLGLFDVTPRSMIAVSLAAISTASIVVDNARLIYLHSFCRGIGGLLEKPGPVNEWVWFGFIIALGLPTIGYAIYFSNKENPQLLRQRITFAFLTSAVELLAQLGIVKTFRSANGMGCEASKPSVFAGYAPWSDHLAALVVCALALLVYGGLGWYGWTRLGKKATVPALCSLLMVAMLLCSVLSALSFFLDLWHVPLILVLLVWGTITARSNLSDHFYDLVPRPLNAAPQPTPIEVVRATKLSQKGRIVVVAANGGGIQAAAWTAKILESLAEQIPAFAPSLRLISSVSGGSLGSVCYVYKQAHPDAEDAFAAAGKSSLDEVSWGVSWPDLIASVFPWITGNFIGRGQALERAWMTNVQREGSCRSELGRPLRSCERIQFRRRANEGGPDLSKEALCTGNRRNLSDFSQKALKGPVLLGLVLYSLFPRGSRVLAAIR